MKTAPQHVSFLTAIQRIVESAAKVHPYAPTWFELGLVKIEIQPPPGSALEPLVIATRDADSLRAVGRLIGDEPYQIQVGQYFLRDGKEMPDPEVWLLPDGTPVVLYRSGLDGVTETRALTPGSSDEIQEENMADIRARLSAWAHEMRATKRARDAARSSLTRVFFE